jgi:hypothetical protein
MGIEINRPQEQKFESKPVNIREEAQKIMTRHEGDLKRLNLLPDNPEAKKNATEAFRKDLKKLLTDNGREDLYGELMQSMEEQIQQALE